MGFITILGLMLACVDVPTAPFQPRPLGPRRSVAGPLGGDVSFGIAPFNGPDSLHKDIPLNAEVADFNTGIHLPDNSTVQIRIRGRISLAQRTDYGGTNMTNYGTLSGKSYSPWGIPSTVPTGGQNLVVRIASNLSRIQKADPADTSVILVLARIDAGLDLHVARKGVGAGSGCQSQDASACYCPWGPCTAFSVPSYALTSTQTISVERLEDDVTLTAVVSTGAKGRMVTFTASALNPRTTRGPGGWTWTPDGGVSQAAACASSANPCVVQINESGWMEVTYYYNGAADGFANGPRHAKVHVTAVDCPTGDSLVDNPAVRAGLEDAWRLSGADSAGLSPSNRREHGGYGFGDPIHDPLHVGTYQMSRSNPADGPCTSANVPGSYGSLVPLLSFHAHPFGIGDQLPSNCIDNFQAGDVAFYAHGYGGLSGADWLRSFEDQLPVLAIDRDSVYIASPPDSIRWKRQPGPGADSLPEPAGNWQSRVHAVPRQFSSCKAL